MKDLKNPWDAYYWLATTDESRTPSLPFVTLGVLNYNRRKELRQTLDILTQAVLYPNYEILVIDNGSTDGSIEMIRSEYPNVRLHEVGKNQGVSARNIEFHLARGKYLYMFDDDTCPGTPATVLRIVQHFEEHPEIDTLSTSYYQPVTGLMETNGWERFRRTPPSESGFEGLYIVEGGVCFRVANTKNIDGYDPAWTGAEGMEYGVHLYKMKRKSFLCPWFLTLHFISDSVRAEGRSYRGHRAYVNSRQLVWMIAKHWPFVGAIPLLALLVLRRLLAMIMYPALIKENYNGLRDGFKSIHIFLKRQPKLTWKQVFGLKRGYYLFYRWG
jgi:hypothetical protein